MSLSDGMGSGPLANEDSSKVVELTQQLLETGFSARSALKLVNTVLFTGRHGTESGNAGFVLRGFCIRGFWRQ